MKGMDDSIIKTLGRWESLAYLRYVQVPRSQLAEISGRLASSTHSNELLKGSLGRDKGASEQLQPTLLPNYTLLGCGTEIGEAVFV